MNYIEYNCKQDKNMTETQNRSFRLRMKFSSFMFSTNWIMQIIRVCMCSSSVLRSVIIESIIHQRIIPFYGGFNICISYELHIGFIYPVYSFHIACIYLSYRNPLKNAFLRSHLIKDFKALGENPRYTGKSPPAEVNI